MPLKMAQFSILSVITLTFLAMTGVASARRGDEITLELEPKANYYLTKKMKSVTLECRAKNAQEVIFTCADGQIPQSSVEMETMDYANNVISGKITVTRSDVRHGNRNLVDEEFYCQCSALDVDGQPGATSQKSYISMAQMGRKFSKQPEDTEVVEGQTATFECGAPKTNPKPEFSWRKNKKRLNVEADNRMSITSSGSLVINQVMGKDVGMYQCVVKNVGGRRESNEAELMVSSDVPTTTTTEASPHKIFPEIIPEGPVFIADFDKEYVMKPTESISTVCSIVNIRRITVNCNNARIELKAEEIRDPESGAFMWVANHVVSAADVMEARDGYSCQCTGWYFNELNAWTRVSGETAQFRISEDDEMPTPTPRDRSFIQDKFIEDPSSQQVFAGGEVVFICKPPPGLPVPTIYWMKDRQRIEQDTHLYLDEDELIIDPVAKSDEGTYTCVAENSAGRKISRARLMVKEPDCGKMIADCMKTVEMDSNPCQKKNCIDDIVEECQDNESMMIIKQVKDARENICKNLENVVQCPALQQCLGTFPNANNDLMLSVGELCGSRATELSTILLSFVTCMNTGLESCGLDVRDSNTTAVRVILEHICGKYDDLNECESVSNCEVALRPFETNSHQYWCRSFHEMQDCVTSDEKCISEENMNDNNNMLQMSMNSFGCPVDHTYLLDTTPEPGMFDTNEPDSEMGYTMTDGTMDSTPEPEDRDDSEESIMTESVEDMESTSEANMGHEMPTESSDDGAMEGKKDMGMDGDGMDSSDMEKGTSPKTMNENPESTPEEGKDEMGVTDDSSPEGTAEEGNAEEGTAEEGTAEEGTAEEGTAEEGDTETVQGDDSDSGASIAMTSILLTTCMQLILATLLSWR